MIGNRFITRLYPAAMSIGLPVSLASNGRAHLRNAGANQGWERYHEETMELLDRVVARLTETLVMSRSSARR